MVTFIVDKVQISLWDVLLL